MILLTDLDAVIKAYWHLYPMYSLTRLAIETKNNLKEF